MSALRAIRALIARDVRVLVRRPTRVVATIGTPLLIWGFLAAGLGRSGVVTGGEYAGYLVPGIATLVVVFGATLGAISLIQDRHDGVMPSIVISPTPAWAIVSARLISTSALGLLQAAPILLLAPTVGGSANLGGMALALLALALVSVGVAGIALGAAWRIDSVAGFHGVMNLVLMPAWFLSGSIAPAGAATPWLATIVRFNPLGAASSIGRHGLGLSDGRAGSLEWALTIGLATLGAVVAWREMVGGIRRGG